MLAGSALCPPEQGERGFLSTSRSTCAPCSSPTNRHRIQLVHGAYYGNGLIPTITIYMYSLGLESALVPIARGQGQSSEEGEPVRCDRIYRN